MTTYLVTERRRGDGALMQVVDSHPMTYLEASAVMLLVQNGRPELHEAGAKTFLMIEPGPVKP